MPPRLFLSCLALMLGIFAAGCAQDAAPGAGTYANPILARDQGGGADPDVIFWGGKYYFYSTNRGNNVFISRDLVHWKKGPQVLPDAFKGVWAPHVYFDPEDGKFYLYYARHYKIGVAVADRPDAMFKDLGYLVIDGIDPDLFRDDDGRLYLYFTHTPAFAMYCVPMKTPTETGGPVTRCFTISQDWEKHSFPINEGPFMMKHDGIYYLLYSGSDGQSIYYAVGYATAPTPIGPFTKNPHNPFFQNLPAILGPGKGSIIRDRSGQLWQLYHQKVDAKHGWARDICLDPVAFDAQGALTGTPTRGVVGPAPACDPALLWSPDIHPRGAFFADRATVTLSTDSAGAEIRFTVDGKPPTLSSPLYVQPVVLNQSATVQARTFAKGASPSAISSARFTKTAKPLPPNPSPDVPPSANPPFKIFPSPELHWQPPPKGAATRPSK